MSTGNIKVNIVDGQRNWLPAPHEVLLQLWRNGTELAHEKTYNANSVTLTFEVRDNTEDRFRVVAFSKDRIQAGFHPVDLVANKTTDVYLMLIRKEAKFDFRDARADSLSNNAPEFADLLARSPASDDAQARFAALLDDQQACAAMLNITTAMNEVPLRKQSMLKYFRRIIWDDMAGAPRPTKPQKDRFYAFVNPDLKNDIVALGREFTEEKNPDKKGHPGATSSFKQNLLSEANIQITFHEKVRDADNSIKAELDIDFFTDPLAHFFIEVVPNTITGGKTDPRIVYLLRWMAARKNGLSFSPPYRIS
jgi:hypothetical protein